MPRMPLPIAQGFYVDESLPISSQQCVNFYPHIPQTKTITDGALIGVSGIDLIRIDNLIDGTNRGSNAMAGIPYFCNGSQLYDMSFTEDTYGAREYTVTDVSGAETIDGSGRAVMANNGEQLCIVAPDAAGQFNAWIYTVAGGLVQVSDGDFLGNASYVCYMDGYFIFAKTASNVFFISDLRDGMVYSAADFASAESDPDPIVALAALNGLLYVFGSITFEQWQDVGGTGFPFTKAVSGNQQKGCSAPYSLTEFNGHLVWIGGGINEKPAIWATSGGEPIKLSTPAIDYLINSGGITLLEQAWTIHWAEKGHNFIAFTVPDICTVVYDASTQLWHERKSIDENENQAPWRPASLVSAYSVLIVGDSIENQFGVLTDGIYTEYSNNITSYFTSPSMDNNGNPFTVNSLELMMETGTAPFSGAGSNPVIRMAVSNDGGRLFSPDIPRYIGRTAEYENRISWDLLGRYSRSFTPKFICDEPIKKVIVKGEIVIAA